MSVQDVYVPVSVYGPNAAPAAEVWPYEASCKYPSSEWPVVPKKILSRLCVVTVEGNVTPGKVASSMAVFCTPVLLHAEVVDVDVVAIAENRRSIDAIWFLCEPRAGVRSSGLSTAPPRASSTLPTSPPVTSTTSPPLR